jgi:hypothetical protein
LDIVDPQGRTVNVLIFGNATLQNEVPPTLEFPVFSTGTLRIREQPVFNAPILAELLVRESALIHGRNEEGDWLRVTIPGTLDLGWVAAEVGQVDGDINTLPIVGVDTPFLRPFQVMTIRSESAALCGNDVATDGVLLQTPNTEDEVTVTINDAVVRIAGTVLIESDGETTTYTVLEGGLNLVDQSFAPGGTTITVPGGVAEPYFRDRLLALPGNNLSPRVPIQPALPAEQITAQIEAYFAPEPAILPTPTVNPNACRYFARRELTLKAGPGTFYESNGVVEVATDLIPTTQNTDADGELWYELDNGSWVPAVHVVQAGDCPPIPVLDFVQAPPTNTVAMETCETSNGPLREGQTVTFEFQPPAADNFPEIESAVRTDPGRISVENTSLYVRVTDPILIASEPERWIRIYRATWTAEAGTYRVESRRLSYILICNLTVRAG